MNQAETIKKLITGMTEKHLTYCLIIQGRGGTGKTENVIRAITELKTDAKYIPNYLTAKGLFNTLQKYNGKLIILDDCDLTLADKQCLSMLRGATFGLPNGRRIVSWITNNGEQTFDFTGKLICVVNDLPKARSPIMRAFISRSLFYKPELTRDDLIELMQKRLKTLDLPAIVKRSILELANKITDDNLNLRIVNQVANLYEVAPRDYLSLTEKLCRKN